MMDAFTCEKYRCTILSVSEFASQNGGCITLHGMVSNGEAM